MMNLSWIPLVVVLLVGGLISGLLVQEFSKTDYERQKAIAEAYCGQVYNDSQVMSANAMGGHGGFHCIANDHGPHYHDIPKQYRQQAYNATQRGEDLNWTVETAEQQSFDDRIPILGVRASNFNKYVRFVILPAVAILLISGAGAWVYGRWRDERSD